MTTTKDSAASSIESLEQLDADNRNTEATGNPPSKQSSARVVSPKESVNGFVPAVSG